MRKKILLLFILCLSVILTGCGKTEKVTCTNEKKYGVSSLKTEAVVKFKKGYKVEYKTVVEATLDSESSAKNFAESYEKESKDDKDADNFKIKSVKQDNNKVTVISYETKDSIKKNKKTKEQVIDELKNSGFECK